MKIAEIIIQGIAAEITPAAPNPAVNNDPAIAGPSIAPIRPTADATPTPVPLLLLGTQYHQMRKARLDSQSRKHQPMLKPNTFV